MKPFNAAATSAAAPTHLWEDAMFTFTEKDFLACTGDRREHLLRYMCRGDNRTLPHAPQVNSWLLRETAPELAYNNPFARVAVGQALMAELQAVRQREADFWFVSASPDRGAHDPAWGCFDPAPLRAWAHEQLDGLNYVGWIEGAYFGNYFQEPERPRVSFHFHTIVWNPARPSVKAVADRIQLNERPCVFGMGASDYRTIPPAEFEDRVRYMSKGFINEYRLLDGEGHERSTVKPRGRVRPGKRPLRPGAAVKLMLTIGAAGLRDYLIAGGQGVEVMEAALAQARDQLSRQQAVRQRRIARAVWGGQAAAAPRRPHCPS